MELPLQPLKSFTASNSSEHNIQPETNSNKDQREKLIKAFRDTLEKFEPSGPVVVITPIMKRAHSLETSKEITFVDSSSCDAENHANTFMLTLCAAEAVPVGIFITKGQTEQCYKQGFNLLMDIMKESAFNGKEAPATFITDDSEAEINAMKKIWPSSSIL
ncbi:hypothetical protein AVEN_206938-1, partial [Araneus ventricosus]